jgi:hypothetical protein
VCWLSTAAIFRQPSILRNLIWPARHKAEEQDKRGVFARQGALRLHAASEFSVKSLDHVCRAQRLPLRFGEREEREELVAAISQARHHARATFGPRALEGRVSSAGGISIGGVDDAVEVVADLGQHVLGRLTLKIAKLVDAATLYSGAWPMPRRRRGAVRGSPR